MGTQTETIQTALGLDRFEARVVRNQSPGNGRAASWDAKQYEDEQIRWLVRQVFFRRESDIPRHVVFSAIQPADIGSICMQVGQILSDQVSGSICVVEADVHAVELESVLINNGRQRTAGQKAASPLRSAARKISDQLWLVPLKAFCGDQQNDLSSAWIR